MITKVGRRRLVAFLIGLVVLVAIIAVVWLAFSSLLEWAIPLIRQLRPTETIAVIIGAGCLLLAARNISRGLLRSRRLLIEFRTRSDKEDIYSRLAEIWLDTFRGSKELSLMTNDRLAHIEAKLLMQASPVVLQRYADLREAVYNQKGHPDVANLFVIAVMEMRRDLGLFAEADDLRLVYLLTGTKDILRAAERSDHTENTVSCSVEERRSGHF